MGGATGPKLCLALRSKMRKKKHPENETSPGPETLSSRSEPYHQDNDNFATDTYASK